MSTSGRVVKRLCCFGILLVEPSFGFTAPRQEWLASTTSFGIQHRTAGRIQSTVAPQSTTTRLHVKAWKKLHHLPTEHSQYLPELIVLDLDNTLWTPELYQLNPKKGPPRARKDIHLFADIPLIFQSIIVLHSKPRLDDANTEPQQQPDVIIPKWAVASRAQNEDWALELLQDFTIPKDHNNHQKKKKKNNDKDNTVLLPLMPDLIDPALTVIQGGTKKRHLQQLRDTTDIPYHKMIFFDDWEVNLQEVAQLGVLSCHCPDGLTWDIFHDSLWHYNTLKEEGDGDATWVGYVYPS